jgi:hypothetical protein
MEEDGEVRLFMWTHGVSRRDLRLPGLLVLLTLGWSIEAVDDRYGSVLMSREESVRADFSMEAP